MSRFDVGCKNRVFRRGGIPAASPAALGVIRRADLAEEKPKIRCGDPNRLLSGFKFEGCGGYLNLYTSHKVRSGSRQIPICGPCEHKLRMNYVERVDEIKKLIYPQKPPRDKPPGSGRQKKQKE